MSDKYQHDHDEELGCYWFNDPPPPSNTRDVARSAMASLDRQPLRPRDLAYWTETASLVMEYFVLQAGAHYSEQLRQRFIEWLKRSPAERRQYEQGDDMTRAALVDWYLRLVR